MYWGRTSVGQNFVGQDVVGQDVVGQDVVGQDVTGAISLGQNVVGQEVTGAISLGQNVVGQEVSGAGPKSFQTVHITYNESAALNSYYTSRSQCYYIMVLLKSTSNYDCLQ